MHKIITIVALFAVVLLAACGNNGDNTLQGKKKKLEDLKAQQIKLNEDIAKLQADIAKLDPSAAQEAKAKLVAITTVQPDTFTHYIDLQGKVDAENIAYVTPQNQGGQVQAIYVKQGDYVKKGQLLMKLNNEAATTQLGPLQVQLNNAEDILRRRQTLWQQGIGTEVELTNARATVEGLQKQINAINVQLGQYNVYAPMSGVAETVNIKVGETFSPQTATIAGIQIVNISNLKVTANVPENYLGQVKEGSNIRISFPDINKTINAKVSLTGKVIDPNSRSFYIEAHLPSDNSFHPNQIAVVQIQDYSNKGAITVPVNTLQTDEEGKFVLVAVNENGKLIARKRTVAMGKMYDDTLEITSGLQPGDQIITQGYQGLYDGQLITTKA
ncbi:efflux RND transporter periplasmic adaptor subunit [Ilyomonas limi]|uniref:Efflux RND transporter periplasmic adaptor subunit n=1 Tax=Ilyomonas limi TaxID=2575867 RepID=A0A4U3L1I9_9BACT|nr:efflux RND transporter periplasmic adaptor subunit [Ilyomonas limi]TKK68652.1 efflux RND transporter periplasmic adaptor subunit [Ilyomonas limi]